MNASEQLRNFIAEHGPSTWAELQEGTKLSKGSLANCLSDDSRFNSTSLPTTMYNAIGLKGPKTWSQIIRHMVKDIGRMYATYLEDCAKHGKLTADAHIEPAIHQFLTKYGKVMSRDDI